MRILYSLTSNLMKEGCHEYYVFCLRKNDTIKKVKIIIGPVMAQGHEHATVNVAGWGIDFYSHT